MAWQRCGLVVALFVARCCDAGESPCKTAGVYDDWLSTPEVFVRTDQPKGLQGLHVACLWRKGDGQIQIEAYKDSLVVDAPELHEMEVDVGTSWKDFRKSLKSTLNLKKATNKWGHLDLKQEFGIFGAYGRRLRSVEAALDAQLIFVVIGGQWLWPPVRKGYVRKLKELGVELETLAVSPVAYKVRGFLKDNECDEIVQVGGDRMESSPVTLMDKDKGKAAKEFRTSSQARINRAESAVLRNIDMRVGKMTRIHRLHNEEVQILKYDQTQYYSAHLDNWDPSFYSDSAWFEHGHNNRFITVFWYLSTVTQGGETLFPRADGLPQPNDMWSCKNGLKIQPEKGTVIFWYSLHPNGNTDPNGLHAACPVEDGQKWSANYWVWNKPKVGNVGANFGELDKFQIEDAAQEEDVRSSKIGKTKTERNARPARGSSVARDAGDNLKWYALGMIILGVVAMAVQQLCCQGTGASVESKKAVKAAKKGRKAH